MSSDSVIRLHNVNKCYQLYTQPVDRLKQFLWRGRRQFFREFWALRDINLSIGQGEVVGIVGCNGAGKSTLLQLICGTLTPSHGDIEVKGRVAALLELGAGFNPEFSGRDNVWMNAAILGLSEAEIAARFDEIVEFSGIADFIDQPVKTYSSGMYMRLAFSVATCVDPDILVIDEALSVGDGAFARKSFERIMQLKNAGKTILFCSHSLYQVEALCDRAVWLDKGTIKMQGHVEHTVMCYQNYLLDAEQAAEHTTDTSVPATTDNVAKLLNITASCQHMSDSVLTLRSLQDDLQLKITFFSALNLPVPHIGIAITSLDKRTIAMVISKSDDITIERDQQGKSSAEIVFTQLPLARGEYWVDVYLGCENAIHVYDVALQAVKLKVSQTGIEQGVVKLPHRWLPQS